jgi:plastocyanin
MPHSRKSVLVVLVIIAALAGCASRGKGQSTAAPMSSGGNIIEIEASSYKFSPNVIRVEKPGLLAIEIKNVSGSEHNFTLQDPGAKKIESVKLNPHCSAIINVELSQPGVYKFYCNRTFHSTLGMNGKIIVGR